MRCPACGAAASTVIDSRPHARSIRRRRECTRCGERWSTWEVMGDDILAVRRVVAAMGGARVVENKSPGATKRRRRMIEIQDERRGFSVPPELKEQYQALKRKGFSAQEVGRMLGLSK